MKRIMTLMLGFLLLFASINGVVMAEESKTEITKKCSICCFNRKRYRNNSL